ncbi:MAG: diacylglycerol kinase family protein [Chitinophagaceae bacterium]
MKQKTISFQSRLSSLRYAVRGISSFFNEEPNAMMHLVATILVIIAAGYFDVSNYEMIALVIVAGFVWVAEIFNTVIERIMDFISAERKPEIEFIKDLSAGGVLLSAFIAVVTGAIIFIPKLF